MVPLNRALSKLGILSRAQASEAIRAGRVKVDGRVVTNPSASVVPERVRITIDGEAFVLKHLHVDDDWIQRATGDVCCRAALLWSAGVYEALPPEIDHAIVGVASGLGRNGWGAALLLRDLSSCFVDVSAACLSPLPEHADARIGIRMTHAARRTLPLF